MFKNALTAFLNIMRKAMTVKITDRSDIASLSTDVEAITIESWGLMKEPFL